jgi:hypothetical protein
MYAFKYQREFALMKLGGIFSSEAGQEGEIGREDAEGKKGEKEIFFWGRVT